MLLKIDIFHENEVATLNKSLENAVVAFTTMLLVLVVIICKNDDGLALSAGRAAGRLTAPCSSECQSRYFAGWPSNTATL